MNKSTSSPPFKILIGPLYHPYLIGAYRNDPHIKVFTMGETSLKQNIQPMEDDPQMFKLPPQSLVLDFDKPQSTLQSLWKQLPKDWRPDLLIWWGFFYTLPPDIAQCPCPSALIVSDWHLHYPVILNYLEAFDYVFGDQALVNLLQARGFKQSSYWPAYGFHPPAFQTPEPEAKREIDICFLGNFQPAQHHIRNRYLRRLAEFAVKHNAKVVISSEIPRSQYRQILQRSKLAFNYSIRGEMNYRAYEAPAAGALLFQEENNLEIRRFLPPGEACVLYNSQNFESLLHYYLNHDAERLALANQGMQAIQAFSYQKQFGQLLSQLEALWPQMQTKARKWKQRSPVQQKLIRAQHQYGLGYPHYQNDALQALDKLFVVEPEGSPESLELLNALAVCSADYQRAPQNPQLKLPKASEIFRLALNQSPKNPILLNNLAWDCFYRRDSLNSWHRAHDAMGLLSQSQLDPHWTQNLEGFVLPLGYNHFQLQWLRHQADLDQHPAHRAASLKKLLLWNLLNLLGFLANQAGQPMLGIPFFREAYDLYPAFGEASYRLALESVKQRDYKAALIWYERSLATDPFNPDAWVQWIEVLHHTRQKTQVNKAVAQAKVLFQAPRFEQMQKALQQIEIALKTSENDKDGFI